MDFIERCIRTSDTSPECHLVRARILLARGSRVDAIEALTKAKRLAEACIDQEGIEAQNASDPRVKNVHEARQDECRSAVGYCTSTLKKAGVDAE
jgi:hypothetical protein